MIGRIIVGYDGSELAREAFNYALTLAQATGAGVEVIHAIEPIPPAVIIDPAMGFDAGPAMVSMHEASAEERRWATDALAELQREGEAQGVAITTRIEFGRLVPLLCDTAGAGDLVAVGHKGRFHSGGIGSTTRSLVEHAPCPVLIVSAPTRPIIRVVTIFNGAAPAKKAIAFADAVAKEAGWPHAVLAVEGPSLSKEESAERAAELAPDASVSPMCEKELHDHGVLSEHAVATDGFALVVMGAYAKSRLQDLLFGGATSKYLKDVAAPVALVH
ncbi:MAG: universal stress protein [Phycisphaeraceae bacterium]|nr:universal stress protein [Phycisphaeraceae bacterium]MCB9847958.1 universal stress protein [Phycisphaeraceae bacterium]